MFFEILNNLIAIQTTQLIIKTKTKHAVPILLLHTRPYCYHYSFYSWTMALWNAMPRTLIESESLDVFFKVELAKQKIQVPSNY